MIVLMAVQPLIYFFFSMTLDSVRPGSATAPTGCSEHNHQTFKYSLLEVGAEVRWVKSTTRKEENQDVRTEICML